MLCCYALEINFGGRELPVFCCWFCFFFSLNLFVNFTCCDLTLLRLTFVFGMTVVWQAASCTGTLITGISYSVTTQWVSAFFFWNFNYFLWLVFMFAIFFAVELVAFVLSITSVMFTYYFNNLHMFGQLLVIRDSCVVFTSTAKMNSNKLSLVYS